MLASLLVACALPVKVVAPSAPSEPPSDRFVLLPNIDGSTGSIMIQAGDRPQLIDRPYASVTVSAACEVGVGNESAASVRRRFGSLLAAQPARPVSFVVYFATGGDDFTAESLKVLEQVRDALRGRAVPEITVIGHTDRVGSVPDNDALALQRAMAVRVRLLRAGIGNDNIEVVGRGEREPLIVTADEVVEPRNRRVEIAIR